MSRDPNDWLPAPEQVHYPDWLSPLEVINGGLAGEAGQPRPKPVSRQHLRLVADKAVEPLMPPKELEPNRP
jgi:hypothetical protein